MTVGYTLTCTVCNFTGTHVNEWNQHLVSRVHQDKTKLSLCEWDENVRKCAVVLYTSFSIADESNAVSVIRNFTGGTTFVTDFVVSIRRPKMAILQFESSKKVKELLAAGTSQMFDNQLIQFRRLGGLLELEWGELMTTFLDGSVVDRVPISQSFSSSAPAPGSYSCTPDAEKEFANRTTNADEDNRRSQIRTILTQVEIPDEEFNTVQRILQHISILLKQFTNVEYSVSLYRNNYLKLRNNVSSNTYLAFMYTLVDDEHGFEVPPKEIWQLLEEKINSTNVQNLMGYRFLEKPDFTHSLELGKQILHQLSSASIRLSSYPFIMAEVQLSRLVSYYCRFDPRVKILLGLLYYWAAVNDISLAQERINGLKAFEMAPNPSALEWLLLFFLCQQEKILPRPVQILNRPHKPLFLSLKGKGQHDLGFDDSTGFQQNPNPVDRSASVTEILQKFMTFCEEKMATSCVVYTQTSKLFHPEDIVKDERVKDIFNFIKKDGNKRIVMFHPLNERWKISLDNTKWFQIVVPAMKKTAKRLGNFNNSSCDGGEELKKALRLNMEKLRADKDIGII